MIDNSDSNRAGIILSGKEVTGNRWLNATSILVPLSLSACIPLSWSSLAPTGATLVVFGVFFVLGVFGIGIGLHRYFTHRAYQTGPFLRGVLAVLGSFALQGPIDRWVADHRRHHRFADKPLDPHSPHWMNGRRPRWKWLGLLNAHVLWMFSCPLTDADRYAADIRQDPITGWCSRNYWWLAAASLLSPALVGAVVGGAGEALLCFFWAGCLRVTLLHHVTWSINSIGHSFGTKVAGSRDESRNITFLSLLLFGEGLHSYHHTHPTAAINEPKELDIGGWVLIGLRRAGLVWDLKGTTRTER